VHSEQKEFSLLSWLMGLLVLDKHTPWTYPWLCCHSAKSSFDLLITSLMIPTMNTLNLQA
jgi:hypothetical protein